MNTLLYFIIGLLTTTLFIGALVICFRAGESSAIAKYGYIEEGEDDTSENN